MLTIPFFLIWKVHLQAEAGLSTNMAQAKDQLVTSFSSWLSGLFTQHCHVLVTWRNETCALVFFSRKAFLDACNSGYQMLVKACKTDTEWSHYRSWWSQPNAVYLAGRTSVPTVYTKWWSIIFVIQSAAWIQSADMTASMFEQNPDGFLWIWVLHKTRLCWK